MKKSSFVIAFVLVACTLQSCVLFRNIVVEDDVVNSTSRIRTEFEYRTAKEWSTPLIAISQTIIRETGKDTSVGIRIYDRVLLNPNSFRLEDRVYLLIDGNPYQAKVEDVQFERFSTINEKRKDVLTADSSKVSVVTGFDRNESNSYKLTYTISPKIVDLIKTCYKLQFRYYAGPDMITTSMNHYELNVLKKLLEK
jgi:hypothetical protein